MVVSGGLLILLWMSIVMYSDFFSRLMLCLIVVESDDFLAHDLRFPSYGDRR